MPFGTINRGRSIRYQPHHPNWSEAPAENNMDHDKPVLPHISKIFFKHEERGIRLHIVHFLIAIPAGIFVLYLITHSLWMN
ncbi:MAG TPA: hypothetical protein VKB96_13575 [Gammaproteobacteria bacterium]|nr:hypothetical protein [Gammaproteobacteria bacterium]